MFSSNTLPPMVQYDPRLDGDLASVSDHFGDPKPLDDAMNEFLSALSKGERVKALHVADDPGELHEIRRRKEQSLRDRRRR